MYRYLSGKLRQLDIRHKDLANILDMSAASVSHRFVGRIPWSIEEMYQIMDLIKAPYDQLHIYFPKGGISA